MNIVCCKIIQCPFNEKEFCTNSVVAIEPDGHCSILWRKGAPQPLSDALNKGNKINLIVEEGDYKDVRCTYNESARDECNESGENCEHNGEQLHDGEVASTVQPTDRPANDEPECGAIETLRNACKESAGTRNDESGAEKTDESDTGNVEQK